MTVSPDSSADEERGAPLTTFLDLDDNVLGILYACCQSNAALRHSCASLYHSPSINAQIRSAELVYAEDDTLDSFVGKLTSFPRNAHLMTLALSSMTDVRAVLELCYRMPDVRASLRNVAELRLKECTLDADSASFLPLLFPKLDALSLSYCSHFDSFLNVLAPQLDLTSLAITLDGGSNLAVHCVGKFELLQSLFLDFRDTADLDVAVLASLRQLRRLSIAHFGPINLQQLLESLSCLHHLRLDCFEAPLGAHFASSTLQTMHVGSIFLDFPALAAHDFPCLRSFGFSGIDFGLPFFWEVEESKEVMVWRTRNLVAWVAGLPSKACEEGTDGTAFALSGLPGGPALLCSRLLGELLPLKSKIAAVSRVEMHDWCLNSDGMLVLGELFGGLGPSGLPEVVASFDCIELTSEVGLMSVLQAMPSLRKLVLHFGAHPRVARQLPGDIIAALSAAQGASRSFCLEIWASEFAYVAIKAALRQLGEQWEGYVASISGPQFATLCFKAREF